MDIFFSFLTLGCLVGLLAGLLGVGGGLTIVPALIYLFHKYNIVPDKIVMHVAIATSLATIIITSLSSVIAHHKRQAILWPIVRRISPSIILGALIFGPLILTLISGNTLRVIFAIFCICAAFQMLLDIRFKAHDLPKDYQVHSAGLIIGSLSAILGIGGGSLTATFLNLYHVPLQRVIGTTAAIGFPIAITGTIGIMLISIGEPELPQWSSGYIYWPAFLSVGLTSIIFAPVGAYFAHRLPVNYLKKIFAAMLFLIGIKIFW